MEAIRSHSKRVYAVRGASLLRAALAALYLMSITVFPSYAAPSDQSSACQWVLVTPEQFFPPPHTKGDMDFKGHGPKVDATVSFHVTPDGIYADVYMKATETRPDWTTAEGSRRLTFLYLRPGYKIARVARTVIATVDNPLVPIGAVDIPASGIVQTVSVQYVDTNHDEDKFDFTKENGLIRELSFVGDTKGPEAGTKTGVKVIPRIGVACISKTR